MTDNEPETECNAICDYGCLYHKEQLIRLEQERDEIQERILTLADTYQETRNVCKRLEQENKELKSALEEINILAKNYCNACDEFKAKTYKNKNGCLYCNYGFIKRKINEVLQ